LLEMFVQKMTKISELQWDKLTETFGDYLRRDVPLAPYTAARVGGSADGLILVESAAQLAKTASTLWNFDVPFIVLGGGSNVLVSDAGIREIILLNRARQIKINEHQLTVWAESGANFGTMARKVSARGYTGLEWAAGIPGTVGGAVFGNAGAHGGDVAGNLIMAEILHPLKGEQQWTPAQMGYAYRSSFLKRAEEKAVILSASFQFGLSSVTATRKLVEDYSSWRKRSQPPGASMGSMFKNPPGDYAGRLIDQAGLKGTQIGEAVISPIHGNFIINQGGSRAEDFYALIRLVQQKVLDKFGVQLELEIELIGEWDTEDA
jgi:UDP-N-acetylmuramate dehydrogenase